MKEFLKEAAKKLDSFTSESKNAVIFFDDDPDGVCSGALLIKYFEKKGISFKAKLHFDEEAKPFSENFNKQIEGIDLLIFTDFNINGFGYFGGYKEYIKNNPGVKVVIFDHHIDEMDYSAENVLYLNVSQLQTEIIGGQYCCSKFVWDVLNELDSFLMKENKWVSIIGIIGDYSAMTWKKFIQDEIDLEVLKNHDNEDIITPEEQDDYYMTPYGQVSSLIFYGIAKDKKESGKILFEVLKSKGIYDLKSKLKDYEIIQKEVYDYVENYDYFEKNIGTKIEPLSIFEVEIKSEHDIASIVANRIASKNPDIIFMVNNELKNGLIHVSCRHQSALIDVGELMKKAAEPFEGANGGGHKVAAGAIVPKSVFKGFRDTVYELVQEMQNGLL